DCYFASRGSIMTNLPMEPLSMNLMRPLILAKSVSSLPRPTYRPGLTRVPRWRTMMVPPGTTCPPKALKPNRCALESRPFRELPRPFLCAIDFQFPVSGFLFQILVAAGVIFSSSAPTSLALPFWLLLSLPVTLTWLRPWELLLPGPGELSLVLRLSWEARGR